MPDYTALAATAQRLVAGAGRAITLVEFNTTPVDSDKPWRGAGNPRLLPKTTLATTGVFVEPSAADKLGMTTEVSDLLKRSNQLVIVSTTTDLQPFNEIIDTDGTKWKIVGMETLKPATIALLYFIGVAR